MKKRTFIKMISFALSVMMLMSFMPLDIFVKATTSSTVSTASFDEMEISYINNEYTGKYLYNSSSNLSSTSGLISNLGTSIRWKITPVGDGTCTISSMSNTTLYLAGAESASSTTVTLTTLSDSSIPNRYRWTITLASGGGCIVQNANTGKYLCASGSTVSSTTIGSASSLGTEGTINYDKKVWRIVDSTYYGTNNSYDYVELPSDYDFKTLYMFSGDTKAPELLDEYSNVMWRTANNFTFAGCSTAYATFNSVTGAFTALDFSSLYSTTVTATHKVTGLTTTFSLVINPRSISIGVTNTNHDHSSAINAISEMLETIGYSSANVYTGAFTVSDIDTYLNNDINNLFVSRSHGGVMTNASTGSQTGTRLKLNDNITNPIYYSSLGSINTLELSNMKLIMFIGCQTAVGGRNGPNLPSVAVSRGTRTAVGFSTDILCSDANSWTEDFFEEIGLGQTVLEACVTLAGSIEYKNTDMINYVMCGYESLKLK